MNWDAFRMVWIMAGVTALIFVFIAVVEMVFIRINDTTDNPVWGWSFIFLMIVFAMSVFFGLAVTP